MIKVGVVYGTNFGSVSPGGIQTVIRSLGANAPGDMAITYFGAGSIEASLPRPHDTYVDVLKGRPVAVDKIPLNLRYTAALTRSRSVLRDMDLLVAHRAEHVSALPLKPTSALVLHGGSRNARMTGRWRAFGLAYPLLEVTARHLADICFSVSVGEHLLASRPSLSLQPLIVPLADPFLNAGSMDRSGALKSVVFCGRLEAEKRPHLALEVAAALGVSCDLIGDGPLLCELKRVARSLGVPLRAHGRLGQEELARLYRRSAGVLLSTSLFEGYSLAVVEAASCGVPVVGLRAPGVARAIAAAGGLVANTPNELAGVVNRAWACGNGVPVEGLRQMHDPQVIGRAFWSQATGCLRRQALRSRRRR